MKLNLALFSMGKYFTSSLVWFLGIVFGLTLLGVLYYSPLYQYWNSWLIEHTQEKYGSKPVEPEHEAFIRAIAQEMNMNEPFIIRTMNTAALQKFGYHNAFAYSPNLWNIIPLSTQHFLFISHGFFEDLSLPEQRFLIGHELGHIYYRHPFYLDLLGLFLTMFVIIGMVQLQKALKIPFGPLSMKDTFSRPMMVLIITGGILGLFSFIARMACHRFIEREADAYSLTYLKAHEGLLKITDRWEHTFKIPTNPYWGLFADHPSHAERREYCKNHQLTIKE